MDVGGWTVTRGWTVGRVDEDTAVCGICLDEPIVFLAFHPYAPSQTDFFAFPWGRRCLDRSEKARKRREARKD